MDERQTPIPDGYTHVELPKPQVRGWGNFWATLGEALDEPEEKGIHTYHSDQLGTVTIPED